MSTCSRTRSQNLNTHLVCFSVVAKDGPSIVLSANVLPQITGAVQHGQNDLDFLHTISPNWQTVFQKGEVHLLYTLWLDLTIYGTQLEMIEWCYLQDYWQMTIIWVTFGIWIKYRNQWLTGCYKLWKNLTVLSVTKNNVILSHGYGSLILSYLLIFILPLAECGHYLEVYN